MSIGAARDLRLRGLGLPTSNDKRARVPKNENVKASGFALDIGSKIAEFLNPIKEEDKIFDNLKIDFRGNRAYLTGLPEIVYEIIDIPKTLELVTNNDYYEYVIPKALDSDDDDSDDDDYERRRRRRRRRFSFYSTEVNFKKKPNKIYDIQWTFAGIEPFILISLETSEEDLNSILEVHHLGQKFFLQILVHYNKSVNVIVRVEGFDELFQN